jgi:hypothetical protein
MTTTATTITEPVPLPIGARTFDTWQDDDPQPYRVILGAYRRVTDHKVLVSPSAVQWADGSVDDGRIEAPQVYIFELGESAPLNSDQARELAAALLEAADEIDGWSAR